MIRRAHKLLYQVSNKVIRPFNTTVRQDYMENRSSEIITEGGAKIWQHEYSKGGQVKQEAFYNKVQVFNRDLSVLVMHTFAETRQKERGEKFKKQKYLDAFTASGLRTLRAKQELSPDLFESFVGCDLSQDAVSNFKKNLELNGLQDCPDVEVRLEDCKKYMSSRESDSCIDIVDIDPYGTAIPFLSSAIQAVNNYGLLCVTCTDMRVLASHDFTKCFYQYGASRAKMTCFEENALRIVLATTSRIANESQKAIVPLISFQRDFYLRIFVQVVYKKSLCWESLEHTGMLYHCPKCTNSHVHQYGTKRDDGRAGFKQDPIELPGVVCNECGSPWHLNGPLWISPLNQPSFVQETLDNLTILEQFEAKQIEELPKNLKNLKIKTKKEIRGVLEYILQEGELAKNPISWDLTPIYQLLKTRTARKLDIFSALDKMGYKTANSYQKPVAFKTNAPNQAVFDVMRGWKEQDSVEKGGNKFVHLEKDSPGYKIMQKPLKYEVNFSMPSSTIKSRLKNKGSRFFPNPEKNWGPKRAASIVVEQPKEKNKEEETEEGEGGE